MRSTVSLGRQSGLSLIELMIASAIGLLLLTGLSMIFVSSSETNREMQKTSQQIENGRYAIDILSQNLRLAGFYGHLHDLATITPPVTIPPDPCDVTVPALTSAMWFPVQAYPGTIDAANPADDAAADVSTTTCAALTAANLKPGSDVLVIRRADTNALAATDVAISNVFYIQAGASSAEIQVGNGAAIGTNKANGNPSTLYLTNGAIPAPPVPIRKYHVHIYFVAPCSIGTATVSGVAGVCQTGDDSIPTLKRLELSVSGAFVIVPLVEGIDHFKIEYGVDTIPTTVNLATGSTGDAAVDLYTTAPADWREAIAAKVYVLARNTVATRGFKDDKTYLLGTTAVPARNDEFKRHVYAAAVRLTNPAGRREIP
ncbi:MAG TPA: PilW family protein [Gemmatimonadales bacterium]|nr:PilW family protein [Gemmatimonadales bacterium]